MKQPSLWTCSRSLGAVARRLRVFISGRSEPGGAASGGRKRLHMLVAYGVRRDSTRHLLAFMRSQGESQAEWEGLLGDLCRRGFCNRITASKYCSFGI
jgi:hypothetical protein